LLSIQVHVYAPSVYTEKEVVYMLDLMTKHLVDIDDKLLARAQAACGAKTIRATVEAGLRRVANDEVIQRHLQRLRDDTYAFDLDALAESRSDQVTPEADDRA
jgi:Arc/MetJ family transcription regulator